MKEKKNRGKTEFDFDGETSKTMHLVDACLIFRRCELKTFSRVEISMEGNHSQNSKRVLRIIGGLLQALQSSLKFASTIRHRFYQEPINLNMQLPY